MAPDIKGIYNNTANNKGSRDGQTVGRLKRVGIAGLENLLA